MWIQLGRTFIARFFCQFFVTIKILLGLADMSEPPAVKPKPPPTAPKKAKQGLIFIVCDSSYDINDCADTTL